MKRILLTSLIFFLAACSNLFHSSHDHLELVKVKAKADKQRSNFMVDDLYTRIDSFGELNSTSYASSDSAPFDLYLLLNKTATTLPRRDKIYEADSKSNIHSVHEQVNNKTKKDDDQNVKEKRKWNKYAVWAFFVAVAGIYIWPLEIVVKDFALLSH